MKTKHSELNSKSELNVKSIPIHQIEQGENSRINFDANELTILMVSMKQTGQLQPIGLTRIEEDRYRIIFGNRRFQAAKKLGWKVIDSTIFETADEASEMIANATENMVREDVSFPEQGRIFHKLIRQGMTLGEVAARVSVPKSRVLACLKAFEQIPVKYRDKITAPNDKDRDRQGKISGTAAVAIINLQKRGDLNTEQTEMIFEYATKNNFSNRDIRQTALALAEGKSVEEALDTADAFHSISLQLSMRKSEVVKLEKQYSMKINEVLRTFLRKHPELKNLR